MRGPVVWFYRPRHRRSVVIKRGRGKRETDRRKNKPTKQHLDSNDSAMASSPGESWIGALQRGLVLSPPSPALFMAPVTVNSPLATAGDVNASVQEVMPKVSRDETHERRQRERLRVRREPSPLRRPVSRRPLGRQAPTTAPCRGE